MIRRTGRALALALAALAPAAFAADAAIERIEPPNWWVGMHGDKLQLMVHGARIAETTPQLRYPGVRIAAVTRTASPNYLFVDLEIAPDAPAGTLDLDFQQGARHLHRPYALQAREKGSAERAGFGAADAVLNLVPDRFADGNPANDDLPGYPDKAKRSDDSASRHGGDIQGIVDHLDYIAGMGYTMLWPTPLLESNRRSYSYHGYAATDLYRIDARFGSNDDYRRMVASARERGIGVIQDIVLNQIDADHWWMKDPPAPDWITHAGRYVPTHHARTAIADPHASQSDRDDFTTGWFTAEMPDMNQRNPLVATYQIQNTIWWVEYAGLAGLRIDTYGYSDTAFLAEWSRRVMQEYPRLTMVGEEWSSNAVVVSHWLRGVRNADGHVSATPGMIDYPLHEALRSALLHDESLHSGLVELYEALVNDVLYPEPMNMMVFEGNHDVPRLFSVLHEDLALYKLAIAYLATTRGIPQLYYGTEVLMTSPTQRDDGATRRDFPGGWAGDKVNAFTGAGLGAAQREAQAYVRRLLNWRKTQGAVMRGKLMHYAPRDGMYVYFRYTNDAKVMVVLNKNREATRLETARFHEMLAGVGSGTDGISGRSFDLRSAISVPPRAALVLELRQAQ